MIEQLHHTSPQNSQCFPVLPMLKWPVASPGLEQRAADGPGVAPRRGSRGSRHGACGFRAAGAAGLGERWRKSGEKWAKIIPSPTFVQCETMLNTPLRNLC